MITPGYFLFISIPTRDIDQRSGRWSFVFFRWTAHMTTAFTPASWHRLIFCSRAPMSFFMYDELEEYTKWGSIVTVQIVVTKNDIGALEQKIERCQHAGVTPAVLRPPHLSATHDN